MNGACVGHHAILMRSMLQFAMHYGRYRCCQRHLAKDRRRKGLPSSALMPSMDIATLLDDEEENLKLQQINVIHVSIMDLLSDPGNPLYAEPHSMAEHYDAMLVGARALGDLPERTRCRDSSTTARVHEDEAQQVCQKILRCLDMRVMDGDLIVPTCLRTPTLILPARRFVQLYYDPDAQGQYASDFPTRGQGFLQPRGDIRTSIVPRNFRILPNDVREVVDLYFHREGLEAQENQESDDCTSTDMEAANTVRCLHLCRPQPPDRKRRNINTTPMTLSLIKMRNIWAWQNGSCNGGLPIRAPPALHRGGHPILVGPSSPTSTNYPI